MVLESLPDEELIRKLEKKRGKGRDDYPLRAMWNSVIARVVFRYESTEKLIEELSRNGQLKYICGFRKYETIGDEQGRMIERKAMIPKSWNYSSFFSKLIKEQKLVDEMFDKALEEIMKLLPDFGRKLAIDGKAIESYAKRENKNTKEDGRRDLDANTGIKQYSGIREDGTKWKSNELVSIQAAPCDRWRI
jgi:hypothetical protein